MKDPRRIGKYRILSQIGSGGMGVVYLAARGNERVALKVIRPDLARNAQFRQRFEREARAALAITGTCTARVVEVDVEGRVPFIATEYVDGPTLDQFVMQHGPLDGDQLKTFALALAEALGAIHRGGLIHRDLKPSNILLSEAGPKVIDFGIAKAIEETSMTGTGLTLGTPAWMAPEQATGGAASTASDVFAWGCLVAFASTGVPPFGYGSADAMLYRVVHEKPNLAEMPYWLLPLVTETLQKAAEDRPTVVNVISQLLADQTVVMVDQTVSMRIADTIAATWHVPDSFGPAVAGRSRRVLVPVTGLLLTAILATAGWMLWPNDDERPALSSQVIQSPPATPEASQLPDARSVDERSLLRSATVMEQVKYLEMDGQAPEEIILSSSEHGGASFSQQYLDIYKWDGETWEHAFDATDYTPPGESEMVIPFGRPGEQGGRQVSFLKGVDFFEDGTEELVAGISIYGATGGPLQTYVFSMADDRVRIDFKNETVRGGRLRVRGDRLLLTAGEYLPKDPMCCPSFENTAIIAAIGGEIRVVDQDSQPTDYYVPPLEEASLSTTSLGPLRVGMTLEEAESASGKQFSVLYDNGSCAQATPINGPRGVSVMFLDGRIARIDIYDGNITTLSGIGIGSSEAEVFYAYPGRIRTETHPYDPAGNYLIFTPEDASDQAFSIIFETDGNIVQSFRGGEREAVSYIEGCL